MIKNMVALDEKELKHTELNHSDGWHRDICQGIIMAYFLVMALIYPFYAPGGYTRIGAVKYEFFRNVSLATLAASVCVIILSIAVRRDSRWIIRNYRRLSVTDWFAYGYLVAVMLSYLCSAYKEDALWGITGWQMGVMTQMIFVLTYFLFSRYFHGDLRWLIVWLTAAAAVFLLGICNRYSIYPIAMEGQTPVFISTLGNINWFCGYWSVTASIGMTLYWCSDRMWLRIAAGVYSFIAMIAGVTQGSESAYPVFAVMLLTLFVLSLGSSKRTHRLPELCIMFAAGCLLGKYMRFLPHLRYNYTLTDDSGSAGVTAVLLTGNAAWWILCIALVCYVLLWNLAKRNILHIENSLLKNRRLKYIVAAAAVGSCCIAAMILMNVSGAFDGSEVFQEDWGHGRGAAWNCGINAYRSLDALHKIVGVGPDCFADYVYDVPELADRLVWQFTNQKLTNAHNEQLTLLVNVGVVGWICFAGLFLTAFVRYMRRAHRQPMLYLCAVSMLAYTVHNLVSFQQVLNTPYIFIVLGIGEKLYRNTAEESVYDCIGHRIVSEEDEKVRPLASGLRITGQIAENLFAVLAVVLCVALTFYTKDGYHRIGDAKFAAYRNIMLTGCVVLFVVVIPYLVFFIKEHGKVRVSVTDGCVLAYLILSWIAAIFGGFYKDAWWGYSGWSMGMMSQISFVLLYLFASRFGKYYRLIFAVLLAAACVVYGIGILHRLLIDPIGFYDELTDLQKTRFLSTLGQATWYGSFLAVTLPVGMGIFLYSDKKVWGILSGVFMTIGFCTLVTQNSDSAYFGLAGAMVVFVMISAKERGMMCRFTGALTLLFASGKVMYYLMQIHPNPAFEADFVTRMMWTSPVTWGLLAICLIITAVLYFIGLDSGSHKYPSSLMVRLCGYTPAAAGVVVAVLILLIVLQSRGSLPQGISDRLADIYYFNWNNDWGNGRGRIWHMAFKMFTEANLRYKLFGVGPDCFNSYLNAYYAEEAALFWVDAQLTNAHNEWMNSLINVGIIGTLAYVGIYVTAIRRFFREHRSDSLLVGITASIVSYMCYNFFCYQQVLCTPFIFLLMGVGEYILRETDKRQSSQVVVDKTLPSV
ncbi:MAG: O-antigen ligase family protein [Lachnospiraceae bacterium]|nr:O-antigen ligase family protein [Lachnospiraceae bacterium]